MRVPSITYGAGDSNESTLRLVLLIDNISKSCKSSFPDCHVDLGWKQRVLRAEDASEWLPAANGRPEQKL